MILGAGETLPVRLSELVFDVLIRVPYVVVLGEDVGMIGGRDRLS